MSDARDEEVAAADDAGLKLDDNRSTTFGDGVSVPPHGAGRNEWRAFLEKTIEGEIVPRLMMAHTVAPSRDRRLGVDFSALKAPLIDGETVEEFTRIIRQYDDGVASTYLDMLEARGVPLETLFLQLLAPAARRLGDMWVNDECSFADVTLGLCRIHRLVHARCNLPLDLDDAGMGRQGTALIVPLPGEQHILGALMVEEFFRRDGWDVCGGPLKSVDELLWLVGQGWFSVVGLSVSSELLLDQCRVAIRSLRVVSQNPAVYVMVGGKPFIERPERVAQIGADATASDGQDAVRRALQWRESLKICG